MQEEEQDQEDYFQINLQQRYKKAQSTQLPDRNSFSPPLKNIELNQIQKIQQTILNQQKQDSTCQTNWEPIHNMTNFKNVQYPQRFMTEIDEIQLSESPKKAINTEQNLDHQNTPKNTKKPVQKQRKLVNQKELIHQQQLQQQQQQQASQQRTTTSQSRRSDILKQSYTKQILQSSSTNGNYIPNFNNVYNQHQQQNESLTQRFLNKNNNNNQIDQNFYKNETNYLKDLYKIKRADNAQNPINNFFSLKICHTQNSIKKQQSREEKFSNTSNNISDTYQESEFVGHHSTKFRAFLKTKSQTPSCYQALNSSSMKKPVQFQLQKSENKQHFIQKNIEFPIKKDKNFELKAFSQTHRNFSFGGQQREFNNNNIQDIQDNFREKQNNQKQIEQTIIRPYMISQQNSYRKGKLEKLRETSKKEKSKIEENKKKKLQQNTISNNNNNNINPIQNKQQQQQQDQLKNSKTNKQNNKKNQKLSLNAYIVEQQKKYVIKEIKKLKQNNHSHHIQHQMQQSTIKSHLSNQSTTHTHRTLHDLSQNPQQTIESSNNIQTQPQTSHRAKTSINSQFNNSPSSKAFMPFILRQKQPEKESKKQLKLQQLKKQLKQQSLQKSSQKSHQISLQSSDYNKTSIMVQAQNININPSENHNQNHHNINHNHNQNYNLLQQ